MAKAKQQGVVHAQTPIDGAAGEASTRPDGWGEKASFFFFFGDYYGQRVGIYDGYILYIYMYWLNLDLLDFVFTFSHWCIQHLEILLVNMYT